jgi:hypothetical protein
MTRGSDCHSELFRICDFLPKTAACGLPFFVWPIAYCVFVTLENPVVRFEQKTPKTPFAKSPESFPKKP